jgi:hypothetical protein
MHIPWLSGVLRRRMRGRLTRFNHNQRTSTSTLSGREPFYAQQMHSGTFLSGLRFSIAEAKDVATPIPTDVRNALDITPAPAHE